MNKQIIIAGYNILIESADFELVLGKRFTSFCAEISPLQGGQGGSASPAEIPPLQGGQGGSTYASPPGGVIPEEKRPPLAPPGGGVILHLKVISGSLEVPTGAKKVFQAPYVEEIEGMRFTRKPEFWSLWENAGELYLKINFPDTSAYESGILKFSLQHYKWELWIDSRRRDIDPMAYPLDSLILYYLTVINGDIMIHASGVNYNGKGYLFSGISGQGKSTMARLCKEAGAMIIHDDRLIIRRRGDFSFMYNTPIYDNEVPRESTVDALYLIAHGASNALAKTEGAKAVTSVMANCIQHNWNKEIIDGLLQAISGFCSSAPVYRLQFVPDKNVIDYLRSNG